MHLGQTIWDIFLLMYREIKQCYESIMTWKLSNTVHPCFSIGTSTQFTLSFDNNRFLFRWEFDDQNDKISFSLRVNTTGWVGFGFSKIAPNNMQDYDVIVGGFKDGQGYLNVSCCYSYEKSFPWSRGGYCNV